MHENSESGILIADLAVVGLGPGGLAAALNRAQQGVPVVVFTDRNFTDRKENEYIRGQILLLQPSTKSFLNLLRMNTLYHPLSEEDHAFFESINKDTVQIKDLERFLYDKLQKHPNITIVNLNNDLQISSVGSDATKHANFIELSNGNRFFCKHIVAADGEKRRFTSLINTNLGLNIEYSPTRYQKKHKYQGVVQVKVKDAASITAVTTETDVNHTSLGWNSANAPQNLIFNYGKDKSKYYFAGDIPEAIFNASESDKHEKLKAWAALFIGKPNDQLEYQSRTKLKKSSQQASTFEMNLTQCNKPLCPLMNGYLAIIGDARRSSNFYFGHGVNDAILLGLEFTKQLSDTPEAFKPENYLHLIKTIDDRLNERMMEDPFAYIDPQSMHDPSLYMRASIFSESETLERKINKVLASKEEINKFAATASAEEIKLFINDANQEQQDIFFQHAKDPQLSSFFQQATHLNIMKFIKFFKTHPEDKYLNLFAQHINLDTKIIMLVMQMLTDEQKRTIIQNLGSSQRSFFATEAQENHLNLFAKFATQEQIDWLHNNHKQTFNKIEQPYKKQYLDMMRATDPESPHIIIAPK